MFKWLFGDWKDRKKIYLNSHDEHGNVTPGGEVTVHQFIEMANKNAIELKVTREAGERALGYVYLNDPNSPCFDGDYARLLGMGKIMGERILQAEAEAAIDKDPEKEKGEYDEEQEKEAAAADRAAMEDEILKTRFRIRKKQEDGIWKILATVYKPDMVSAELGRFTIKDPKGVYDIQEERYK